MADRVSRPTSGQHPHRNPVGGPPPPQATMGLLNYITAHSLDEDYAHVASRKAGRGQPTSTRPGRGGLFVMAAFGVLIVTAGVQTARSAGVEASSHENLVQQVTESRERLEETRGSLAALEAEEIRVRNENRSINQRENATESMVARLSVQTGAVAVTGPGVRISVDDAPNPTRDAEYVLDKDLRNIVNGLWEAGAEAISINGERISTRSAIRLAGSSITVNYVSLAAPYTVLAIGDPDALPARFAQTTSGRAWLNARNTFGLVFDVEVDDSLTIPAVASARLAVNQASQPKNQEGAQ